MKKILMCTALLIIGGVAQASEGEWSIGSGMDYYGRPGLNQTTSGKENEILGDFEDGTKHNYEWNIVTLGYKKEDWKFKYDYNRNFYRNFNAEEFEGKDTFEGQSRTDDVHRLTLGKDIGTYSLFGRDWDLGTAIQYRYITEGNIHRNNKAKIREEGYTQNRIAWAVDVETDLTKRLELNIENELQYRDYDYTHGKSSASQIRNYTTVGLKYEVTKKLDFKFENELYYRNGRGSGVDERWQWNYDYNFTYKNKLNKEFTFVTTLGTWGEYQFERKGKDANDHDQGELYFMPTLVYKTKINGVSFETYGGAGYIYGYDTHESFEKAYSGIEVIAGMNAQYKF